MLQSCSVSCNARTCPAGVKEARPLGEIVCVGTQQPAHPPLAASMATDQAYESQATYQGYGAPWR